MSCEMRLLNAEQIEQIYQEHLVKDFPADEVKPLQAILRMLEDGGYEAFGLYAEDELRGYAFFTRQGEATLIDYYAILEGCRGKGYGSLFLDAMRQHYRELPGILFEVERPEKAKNEADRQLRERRIHFYLRNGLVDTGLRVTVFGVAFRMLYLTCKGKPAGAQVERDLERLYRYMIPGVFYDQRVVWEASEPVEE